MTYPVSATRRHITAATFGRTPVNSAYGTSACKLLVLERPIDPTEPLRHGVVVPGTLMVGVAYSGTYAATILCNCRAWGSIFPQSCKAITMRDLRHRADVAEAS